MSACSTALAASSAANGAALACSSSLWRLLGTATRELRKHASSSSSSSVPIWPEPVAFCGASVPADRVFFCTSLSFAMLAPRPVLPGHAVVTPRREVKALYGLSSEEVDDLFLATQVVSYILNRVTGTGSCTMVLQQGEAAGQCLPQLYVHLVPRRKDDLSNNDDIYPLLEKSLPFPLDEEGALHQDERQSKSLQAADFREWILQMAADKHPLPSRPAEVSV
ncbi:UNVERIFIED_CONTAM: histidine triad domain-containing protein [Hammondia hammondi]|eukprot:XP_008881924.1 histidine triad domain-containing protein [Hammondia hammondi]